MKKLIIIISLICLCSLLCSCGDSAYEAGYEAGFADGFREAEYQGERERQELWREYFDSVDRIGWELIDPEDFAREIKEGLWSKEDLKQWYIDLFNVYLEEWAKVN